MSNRHLQILQSVDLSSIVAIHQRAFPDSAMTRLGNEAVRRYYEWLICGPHPEAFRLGLFEGLSLCGFCFGGRFNGATGGFLQRNRLFLIWRVMTNPWLITNPLFRDRIKSALLILRRLGRASAIPPVSWQELANPSFGILAIATHPGYQGQGVGRQLMNAAEGAAREKGFRQMHLTVHPDNHQAVRFYENLGWIRKNEEDQWKGLMRKKL